LWMTPLVKGRLAVADHDGREARLAELFSHRPNRPRTQHSKLSF
jgi:hypothetical protein